jgi:hypothetical protein
MFEGTRGQSQNANSGLGFNIENTSHVGLDNEDEHYGGDGGGIAVYSGHGSRA